MVIALLVILGVDLVVRLGSDPIIVPKTGTASVEMAAPGDELDRVSGPCRPAEAGHV